MASISIEKLVYDTLYFHRMIPGTCLQANLAGKELARQSGEALPPIENVLATVVIPDLSQVRKHLFPGSVDSWFEEEPFPGLNDLLGAYMVIGSKHNVTRIVGFLLSLPPIVQAKAVALVPVVFQKAKYCAEEKEVNEQKDKPDKQLLHFIMDASQSENQVLRENAMWAISFFPSQR